MEAKGALFLIWIGSVFVLFVCCRAHALGGEVRWETGGNVDKREKGRGVKNTKTELDEGNQLLHNSHIHIDHQTFLGFRLRHFGPILFFICGWEG